MYGLMCGFLFKGAVATSTANRLWLVLVPEAVVVVAAAAAAAAHDDGVGLMVR